MPPLSLRALCCLLVVAATTVLASPALEKRATVTAVQPGETVTSLKVWTTLYTTTTVSTIKLVERNSTVWETNTKPISDSRSNISPIITKTTTTTITRGKGTTTTAAPRFRVKRRGPDVTTTVIDPDAVTTAILSVVALERITRTIYTKTVVSTFATITQSTIVTVSTPVAAYWTQITWLIATETVEPNPNAKLSELDENHDRGLNLGTVIGGVIGGLAFVTLLVALCIFLRRRSLRKDKKRRITRKVLGSYSAVGSSQPIDDLTPGPPPPPERQTLMSHIDQPPTPAAGSSFSPPFPNSPPPFPVVIPPSNPASSIRGALTPPPATYTQLSPAPAASRNRTDSLAANIMPPPLTSPYTGSVIYEASPASSMHTNIVGRPPTSSSFGPIPGTYAVSKSSFKGNSASSRGSGPIPGTYAVSKSSLKGNSASSRGSGPIPGTYAVSKSSLKGNSASSRGSGPIPGTHAVSKSSLKGNSASSRGSGRYGEKIPRKTAPSPSTGGSQSSRDGSLFQHHQDQLRVHQEEQAEEEKHRDITPQHTFIW